MPPGTDYCTCPRRQTAEMAWGETHASAGLFGVGANIGRPRGKACTAPVSSAHALVLVLFANFPSFFFFPPLGSLFLDCWALVAPPIPPFPLCICSTGCSCCHVGTEPVKYAPLVRANRIRTVHAVPVTVLTVAWRGRGSGFGGLPFCKQPRGRKGGVCLATSVRRPATVKSSPSTTADDGATHVQRRLLPFARWLGSGTPPGGSGSARSRPSTPNPLSLPAASAAAFIGSSSSPLAAGIRA